MCPAAQTEMLRCSNCRRPYPPEGAPYRCLTCGGLFDYADWPAFDPSLVDVKQPGIWRYRHAFGLAGNLQPVSLNEGDTPLEWRDLNGRLVGFKLENTNPTGSFKDRGATLQASFLRHRGVAALVEDSSCNAGAALAAYSQPAGMRANIFMPDNAPPEKRALVEAFGARVTRVMGGRSNAAHAALEAAGKGQVYASHAYSPIVLPGYATIAYELYQQLGGSPGTLLVPAGQGSLLLGIGRGFLALRKAGLIEALPRLVGVQAMACAPLWAAWRYGAAGLGWVSEGETLAQEVRVKFPARGDAVLAMMKETDGVFLVVDEEEITPGRDQLSELGFNVEDSAAIIWSALSQTLDGAADPVVALLAG